MLIEFSSVADFHLRLQCEGKFLIKFQTDDIAFTDLFLSRICIFIPGRAPPTFINLGYEDSIHTPPISTGACRDLIHILLIFQGGWYFYFEKLFLDKILDNID